MLYTFYRDYPVNDHNGLDLIGMSDLDLLLCLCDLLTLDLEAIFGLYNDAGADFKRLFCNLAVELYSGHGGPPRMTLNGFSRWLHITTVSYPTQEWERLKLIYNRGVVLPYPGHRWHRLPLTEQCIRTEEGYRQSKRRSLHNALQDALPEDMVYLIPRRTSTPASPRLQQSPSPRSPASGRSLAQQGYGSRSPRGYSSAASPSSRRGTPMPSPYVVRQVNEGMRTGECGWGTVPIPGHADSGRRFGGYRQADTYYRRG